MTNVLVFKFATLVASESDNADLYSEPIALQGNDKLALTPIVHYVNGPNTPSLSYTTEVSNDGVNWQSQGPSDTIATPSTGVQTQKSDTVYGQFFRVSVTYSVTGGGSDSGAICLDLQGLMMKAQ